MDIKIEEELSKSTFNSQEELETHINHILSLINTFEEDLYDKEAFTSSQQIKIRRWRKLLFEKSQLKNTIEDIPEVLESTARIVNRQLNKMDTNRGVLKKGTLKLMGLNYTNEDIEKGLSIKKERLEEKRKIEEKEIRLVYLAFIFFLGVCLIVLGDKLYNYYCLLGRRE